MNTQYLQYVREQLIVATADLSGATKGQLEACLEHAQFDTGTYKRKKPRILLHIQRQQNACDGRSHRDRQNMQWWQSGLAVWYRCHTIQPAGYVPVQTFQNCHYIRQGFLPGIPDHALLFSNQP